MHPYIIFGDMGYRWTFNGVSVVNALDILLTDDDLLSVTNTEHKNQIGNTASIFNSFGNILAHHILYPLDTNNLEEMFNFDGGLRKIDKIKPLKSLLRKTKKGTYEKEAVSVVFSFVDHEDVTAVKQLVQFVLDRKLLSYEYMNDRLEEKLLTYFGEKHPTEIGISGRRWFDKTCGNTYFSAYMFVDGHSVGVIPFEYGYDNHYEEVAYQWLVNYGYAPRRERHANGVYDSPRNTANKFGITYVTDVIDVKRKKDL